LKLRPGRSEKKRGPARKCGAFFVGRCLDDHSSSLLSSPKFTQPLLDTTQTISVITKELLQQQGATTLTEALRNSPGVGTFFVGENGSTTTGDGIYMRGFDTRGMRVASFFWVQSLIRDDSRRHLLFELDASIQTLTRTGADADALLQLTGVYHNLLRQWAET
jgi:hypothetical protein